MDSYIEFITTDSIEGIEVYTRTLAFLLTAAATRVLGVRLHLTQSMLYSYFYESPERELSEEDCARCAPRCAAWRRRTSRYAARSSR